MLNQAVHKTAVGDDMWKKSTLFCVQQSIYCWVFGCLAEILAEKLCNILLLCFVFLKEDEEQEREWRK
jgi:hypothetical protein